MFSIYNLPVFFVFFNASTQVKANKTMSEHLKYTACSKKIDYLRLKTNRLN